MSVSVDPKRPPPLTAVEAAWRRYLAATRRARRGREYEEIEAAAWGKLVEALERAGAPLERR